MAVPRMAACIHSVPTTPHRGDGDPWLHCAKCPSLDYEGAITKAWGK